MVRAYQPLAFRTAYLILGSTGEADDAVQEAFVKAYYALGRFRADSPLRPWIMQIVANEAKNRGKASSRRARLSLRLAEGDHSGGAAPSPEMIAIQRSSNSRLLSFVDELRDQERLVIICRYFLEFGEQETAQILGIRRGTVKSRTSRALARLKLRVGDRDEL